MGEEIKMITFLYSKNIFLFFGFFFYHDFATYYIESQ
jgi:hypothetical protein